MQNLRKSQAFWSRRENQRNDVLNLLERTATPTPEVEVESCPDYPRAFPFWNDFPVLSLNPFNEPQRLYGERSLLRRISSVMFVYRIREMVSFKQRKMSCHERGTKEKIVSPHEESNLRSRIPRPTTLSICFFDLDIDVKNVNYNHSFSVWPLGDTLTLSRASVVCSVIYSGRLADQIAKMLPISVEI